MKKTTLNIFLLAAIVFVVAVSSFFVYWSYASPQKTCVSCHEMQINYNEWIESYHRDINCKECHGGTFSNGFHSVVENGKRVVGHFAGTDTENMRMDQKQVFTIIDRCKKCHQSEYADWQAGGHSVTYSYIYLNEKHNSVEQPHNDCMRCHGMFFEGSIDKIVDPVSISGPWKLVDPSLADKPVIPCLACHHIHRPGQPANPPDYSNPAMIASLRPDRLVNLELYSWAEKTHFPASQLPVPTVFEGERKITISDDMRQRVCTQCHAPDGFHRAGTSDDRTPRGVHEGISCLSCHAAHKHETSWSCGNCHPALSNCGLDVKTMDTSFKDPKSKFNIHFVSCADCHKDERAFKKRE